MQRVEVDTKTWAARLTAVRTKEKQNSHFHLSITNSQFERHCPLQKPIRSACCCPVHRAHTMQPPPERSLGSSHLRLVNACRFGKHIIWWPCNETTIRGFNFYGHGCWLRHPCQVCLCLGTSHPTWFFKRIIVVHTAQCITDAGGYDKCMFENWLFSTDLVQGGLQGSNRFFSFRFWWRLLLASGIGDSPDAVGRWLL